MTLSKDCQRVVKRHPGIRQQHQHVEQQIGGFIRRLVGSEMCIRDSNQAPR